jgi:N-acetyl-1-D-myo-inositol-2-amino-2-deoxy-alpha-D-glucopyranoside deacetylase
MEARGLATDLWGIDPDAFGTPVGSITTSIDIHRFLPAKLAALRSHRTQIGSDHLLGAMPEDLAAVLFGREYFTYLAQPPGPRDWLAETITG